MALLGQLRQLPDEVGDALPFSHHKLLLPLKDNQVKLALAREAVASKLGKRELEARVRAAQQLVGKPTGAGRPQLPSWAKGIGAIQREILAAQVDAVSLADVLAHGADKIAARLAEVDAASGALVEFRASLLAVLQQAGLDAG